jgi:hypothetical protein
MPAVLVSAFKEISDHLGSHVLWVAVAALAEKSVVRRPQTFPK